jgi:hypothetical protein
MHTNLACAAVRPMLPAAALRQDCLGTNKASTVLHVEVESVLDPTCDHTRHHALSSV